MTPEKLIRLKREFHADTISRPELEELTLYILSPNIQTISLLDELLTDLKSIDEKSEPYEGTDIGAAVETLTKLCKHLSP